MSNHQTSRKRNWIIAGCVLIVLLIIGVGVPVVRTINEGNRIGKYSTTEKCRAAIAAGDTDPIAYENLAAFQSSAHQNAQAIQTLRQGLKLNPDDRFAKSLLSGALIENGQSEEAVTIDKELAQSNDDWGRRARRQLHRNHIPGY